MTYNIGTSVLSILCIIALYLMNDDNDDDNSKRKSTRMTENDEDVEDDENIHHLRDPLFKKQVEVLATQKELEEQHAQLHENIDMMKRLEDLRQKNIEIAAEQELQRKNRPITPESTEFTPRRTRDVKTRYSNRPPEGPPVPHLRGQPLQPKPELRPRRSRL